MKQFDVKEYNKMCADFMQMEYADERSFNKETEKWIHSIKSLDRFHTDWNWIMEVVEKIKPIVFMSKTRPLMDHNTNLRYALMSAEKELVVKMIWEFLNWYKTQTA
jgi:hypothetical protein